MGGLRQAPILGSPPHTRATFNLLSTRLAGLFRFQHQYGFLPFTTVRRLTYTRLEQYSFPVPPFAFPSATPQSSLVAKEPGTSPAQPVHSTSDKTRADEQKSEKRVAAARSAKTVHTPSKHPRDSSSDPDGSSPDLSPSNSFDAGTEDYPQGETRREALQAEPGWPHTKWQWRSNGWEKCEESVTGRASRKYCLGVLQCSNCNRLSRPNTDDHARRKQDGSLCTFCANGYRTLIECDPRAIQLRFQAEDEDEGEIREVCLHRGEHTHPRPPGGRLNETERRAVKKQVRLRPEASAHALRTGNAMRGIKGTSRIALLRLDGLSSGEYTWEPVSKDDIFHAYRLGPEGAKDRRELEQLEATIDEVLNTQSAHAKRDEAPAKQDKAGVEDGTHTPQPKARPAKRKRSVNSKQVLSPNSSEPKQARRTSNPQGNDKQEGTKHAKDDRQAKGAQPLRRSLRGQKNSEADEDV
ncbi:hypothetical protein PENSPDRAFT_751367 [Peniophora sp. CONT]|nr:hypothetical protein PENSPDRAFT_751367 [Peniophora sp. CONT]